METALSTFRRAVAAKEDDAAARLWLARALRLSHCEDEALVHAKEAVKLAPFLEEAKFELALLTEEGEGLDLMRALAKSRTEYKSALKTLLVKRARGLVMQEGSAAENLVEEALALPGENVTASLLLAELLICRTDFYRAEDVLTKLLADGASPAPALLLMLTEVQTSLSRPIGAHFPLRTSSNSLFQRHSELSSESKVLGRRLPVANIFRSVSASPRSELVQILLHCGENIVAGSLGMGRGLRASPRVTGCCVGSLESMRTMPNKNCWLQRVED